MNRERKRRVVVVTRKRKRGVVVVTRERKREGRSSGSKGRVGWSS